jgi:hypothetical protein
MPEPLNKHDRQALRGAEPALAKLETEIAGTYFNRWTGCPDPHERERLWTECQAAAGVLTIIRNAGIERVERIGAGGAGESG